jgi:hypothetical protein
MIFYAVGGTGGSGVDMSRHSGLLHIGIVPSEPSNNLAAAERFVQLADALLEHGLYSRGHIVRGLMVRLHLGADSRFLPSAECGTADTTVTQPMRSPDAGIGPAVGRSAHAAIRANLFLARRRPLLAYGRSLLRLAEPVHGAAEPAVAVSSGDWVHPAAAGSRP